jgi:hypothetical protein
MKQRIINILKWFESLNTFVKVLGIVIPLLVGAVKLVTAHDDKVRAEYETQRKEQQDQTELNTNVRTILDSVASFSVQWQRIKPELVGIRAGMDEYKIVFDHITKSPTDPPLTLKQLKEYLESAPTLEKVQTIPEYNIKIIPHIK